MRLFVVLLLTFVLLFFCVLSSPASAAATTTLRCSSKVATLSKQHDLGPVELTGDVKGCTITISHCTVEYIAVKSATADTKTRFVIEHTKITGASPKYAGDVFSRGAIFLQATFGYASLEFVNITAEPAAETQLVTAPAGSEESFAFLLLEPTSGGYVTWQYMRLTVRDIVVTISASALSDGGNATPLGAVALIYTRHVLAPVTSIAEIAGCKIDTPADRTRELYLIYGNTTDSGFRNVPFLIRDNILNGSASTVAIWAQRGDITKYDYVKTLTFHNNTIFLKPRSSGKESRHPVQHVYMLWIDNFRWISENADWFLVFTNNTIMGFAVGLTPAPPSSAPPPLGIAIARGQKYFQTQSEKHVLSGNRIMMSKVEVVNVGLLMGVLVLSELVMNLQGGFVFNDNVIVASGYNINDHQLQEGPPGGERLFFNNNHTKFASSEPPGKLVVANPGPYTRKNPACVIAVLALYGGYGAFKGKKIHMSLERNHVGPGDMGADIGNVVKSAEVHIAIFVCLSAFQYHYSGGGDGTVVIRDCHVGSTGPVGGRMSSTKEAYFTSGILVMGSVDQGTSLISLTRNSVRYANFLVDMGDNDMSTTVLGIFVGRFTKSIKSKQPLLLADNVIDGKHGRCQRFRIGIFIQFKNYRSYSANELVVGAGTTMLFQNNYIHHFAKSGYSNIFVFYMPGHLGVESNITIVDSFVQITVNSNYRNHQRGMTMLSAGKEPNSGGKSSVVDISFLMIRNNTSKSVMNSAYTRPITAGGGLPEASMLEFRGHGPAYVGTLLIDDNTLDLSDLWTDHNEPSHALFRVLGQGGSPQGPQFHVTKLLTMRRNTVYYASWEYVKIGGGILYVHFCYAWPGSGVCSTCCGNFYESIFEDNVYEVSIIGDQREKNMLDHPWTMFGAGVRGNLNFRKSVVFRRNRMVLNASTSTREGLVQAAVIASSNGLLGAGAALFEDNSLEVSAMPQGKRYSPMYGIFVGRGSSIFSGNVTFLRNRVKADLVAATSMQGVVAITTFVAQATGSFIMRDCFVNATNASTTALISVQGSGTGLRGHNVEITNNKVVDSTLEVYATDSGGSGHQLAALILSGGSMNVVTTALVMNNVLEAPNADLVAMVAFCSSYSDCNNRASSLTNTMQRFGSVLNLTSNELLRIPDATRKPGARSTMFATRANFTAVSGLSQANPPSNYESTSALVLERTALLPATSVFLLAPNLTDFSGINVSLLCCRIFDQVVTPLVKNLIDEARSFEVVHFCPRTPTISDSFNSPSATRSLSLAATPSDEVTLTQPTPSMGHRRTHTGGTETPSLVDTPTLSETQTLPSESRTFTKQPTPTLTVPSDSKTPSATQQASPTANSSGTVSVTESLLVPCNPRMVLRLDLMPLDGRALELEQQARVVAKRRSLHLRARMGSAPMNYRPANDKKFKQGVDPDDDSGISYSVGGIEWSWHENPVIVPFVHAQESGGFFRRVDVASVVSISGQDVRVTLTFRAPIDDMHAVKVALLFPPQAFRCQPWWTLNDAESGLQMATNGSRVGRSYYFGGDPEKYGGGLAGTSQLKYNEKGEPVGKFGITNTLHFPRRFKDFGYDEVVRIQSAGDVGAVVMSLLGGSAGLSMVTRQARSKLLLRSMECVSSETDDAEYDFFSSPIPFGSDPETELGGASRSAAFGNLSIVGAYIVVSFAITFAFDVVDPPSGKKKKKQGDAGIMSNDVGDHILPLSLKAQARAHWPGNLVIPIAFLGGGFVTAGMCLLRIRAHATDIALGAAALLVGVGGWLFFVERLFPPRKRLDLCVICEIPTGGGGGGDDDDEDGSSSSSSAVAAPSSRRTVFAGVSSFIASFFKSKEEWRPLSKSEATSRLEQWEREKDAKEDDDDDDDYDSDDDDHHRNNVTQNHRRTNNKRFGSGTAAGGGAGGDGSGAATQASLRALMMIAAGASPSPATKQQKSEAETRVIPLVVLNRIPKLLDRYGWIFDGQHRTFYWSMLFEMLLGIITGVAGAVPTSSQLACDSIMFLLAICSAAPLGLGVMIPYLNRKDNIVSLTMAGLVTAQLIAVSVSVFNGSEWFYGVSEMLSLAVSAAAAAFAALQFVVWVVEDLVPDHLFQRCLRRPGRNRKRAVPLKNKMMMMMNNDYDDDNNKIEMLLQQQSPSPPPRIAGIDMNEHLL